MHTIDKVDIRKIKTVAEQYNRVNTEIREGQALYYAAHDLFPITTEKIRNKPEDCFYDDERIPAFLNKLQEMPAE